MFSLAIVNYLYSQMDIFVFTLCTRYYILLCFTLESCTASLTGCVVEKKSLQVGHKYCHSIKSFTLLVM